MRGKTETARRDSRLKLVLPLPHHQKEKQMEFFEERPKVNLEIDKDGKVLSLKRTYKSKPIDTATRPVTKLPQGVE
jgi:hypothetical protein